MSNFDSRTQKVSAATPTLQGEPGVRGRQGAIGDDGEIGGSGPRGSVGPPGCDAVGYLSLDEREKHEFVERELVAIFSENDFLTAAFCSVLQLYGSKSSNSNEMTLCQNLFHPVEVIKKQTSYNGAKPHFTFELGALQPFFSRIDVAVSQCEQIELGPALHGRKQRQFWHLRSIMTAF